MLQSYPSSLVHPTDIFKFQMNSERQSPIYSDARDEEHSNTHEQDDGSFTSSPDVFRSRSNSTEAIENQPLNLTCKSKNYPEPMLNSIDLLEKRISQDNTSSQVGAKTFYPITALEHAALQFQANVIASNDLLRTFAHQKLQENLTIGRALYPSVQIGSNLNSWVPQSGYPVYQYPLYPMPYSSLKHLSNSVVEEKFRKTSLTSSQSSHFSNSSLDLSSSPYSSHSSVNSSQSPISSSLTDNNNLNSNQSLILEKTEDVSCRKQTRKEHSNSDNSTINSNKNYGEPVLKRKRSKRIETNSSGIQKESYPCSICGAIYPHKFELNRHIKVSHVRPHRCGQCGKGFGHRNYLKVHIETVHLGQKSHQCRLCGKYLSTGGNLNVHIRTIHYGEKKYNCPVCNRSFGQQCNMKTHMKRHYSKSDGV